MRTISHSTRFRQMNQEVYNKLTNAFKNTCRIAGLFAVFHHNTFTLLFVCSRCTCAHTQPCTHVCVSDLWASTSCVCLCVCVWHKRAFSYIHTVQWVATQSVPPSILFYYTHLSVYIKTIRLDLKNPSYCTRAESK